MELSPPERIAIAGFAATISGMKVAMTRDKAETLALDALAYLAADADAFGRFADLSGLDPKSAAARAGEPDFLASVLDFLLTDEVLLACFCDDASIDPRQVHLARHLLSGP